MAIGSHLWLRSITFLGFVWRVGKGVFLLKAKGSYLSATFQWLFETEVTRTAEQREEKAAPKKAYVQNPT